MENENETHYDQDWIDDIAIEDYLLNKVEIPKNRKQECLTETMKGINNDNTRRNNSTQN